MSVERRYRALMLVVVLFAATTSWAQKLPERRHIREGNDHYSAKNFDKAMDGYLEALKLDSMSVEAAFNMGDVFYAGGEYEAAEQSFANLAKGNPQMTTQQRAKTYYNLGNSQFQQEKYEEALESYKESLRLQPDDMQTKFNYLLTKDKLSNGEGGSDNQQDQNQDQNQDQQDQNQQGNQGEDNNQDQNQDQNSPNQDQNKDQNNPNQDQNNPEQSDNPEPEGEKPEPSEGDQQRPEGEQPAPSKMSEQILDAVQHTEDQTREKVEERQVVGVGASGKNW